jgi:hypothetical protein
VAARGKPSGRLVTYVSYSPSFETPDEGATNGRLTGIQAVRSQAQPSAAGPSLSLAMSLTTILTTIRVWLPKGRILRKIGRLGRSWTRCRSPGVKEP